MTKRCREFSLGKQTEQEVAGYRDALGLIHESGDRMPFSEGTVLQLHGILYRHMPRPGGHWKAINKDLIERHPDGSSRIRSLPVAAHLAPMAMTDLVARYRAALDQHPAGPRLGRFPAPYNPVPQPRTATR